jgi:hypothetical protein
MITITFQGKDLEEVANQAVEFVAALMPPVQVQGSGAHDDVSNMLAFSPAVMKAASAAGEVEDKVALTSELTVHLGEARTEPPSQEKKADPEELRAQIRAVLAPVMASPRAGEAKALIAQHGGAVSKIAEDSLAVVLEAARALAS